MPRAAQLVLRGFEYFTWPLKLDDYLGLITPLWSTNELRGRIERVHRETNDTATVSSRPASAGGGTCRASIYVSVSIPKASGTGGRTRSAAMQPGPTVR
jgi:hypothetical protein